MNASALPPMLALVGLASVGVLYQALRRGMLRRLALRDALRRPSETALVVIGSLLGTAIITGSYIVGDTLDSSNRATAATQLGPVDEVVTVPDLKLAGDVRSKIEAIDDPRIDGVASFVSVGASFSAGSGTGALAEPEARALELDFEQGRSFGDDPSATGISGATPDDGEVVLGADLAATLEVSRGDSVTGYLFGKKLDFEVARVLPRLGLAGYWEGLESRSSNAFIAPGTIEGLAGRSLPEGAEPPATKVVVSNRGGVEDGVENTSEVTRLMESALEGTPLRVEESKKEVLDSAEAQGKQFSEFFLAIGSFAVVAGVLLLVNIFVMLA
ncbi:MAG: ABC transporter permease, partial [Actinobacteria bacterium]|nr:ABC transporter permease [Actinomycetota bacterium]